MFRPRAKHGVSRVKIITARIIRVKWSSPHRDSIDLNRRVRR
jgi:hypothetical protein